MLICSCIFLDFIRFSLFYPKEKCSSSFHYIHPFNLNYLSVYFIIFIYPTLRYSDFFSSFFFFFIVIYPTSRYSVVVFSFFLFFSSPSFILLHAIQIFSSFYISSFFLIIIYPTSSYSFLFFSFFIERRAIPKPRPTPV